MSTAQVRAPNFTRDSKKGFATLAELLGDIRQADTGGAGMSERLRYLAQGADEQQSASRPYGGFLVPSALTPSVLRVPVADNPMSGVTEIEMRAPVHTLPARVDKNHSSTVTGGILMSRHPETVELTAQRAEVEQVTLNSYDLAAFTFGTARVVDDSAGAFMVWLESCFRDALADVLRNERIRGSGVGEPLGVLSSPCLVTVSAENGQVGGTVVAPNVLKMASRCWGFDSASTTWIANPELRQQLSALVDANGKPLYFFPEVAGERPRLCGRPVHFDERADVAGQVGDLILGVWSEYLNGTYIPPNVTSSLHVRFISREIGFRLSQRGDGTPWWRSTLTPRYGTDTMSPFVVLAERS